MRHATAGVRWGWVVAAGLGLATAGLEAQTMTTPKTIGSLITSDPRFDTLIAPDATLDVLAGGYDWSEGPVWVPRDGGFLLWSDVPANVIHKWSPGQAAAPFMKPSGFTGVGKYSSEPGSNGLTLDKQGRLIAAEHGDRRVSRFDWTGGKRTIADNWQGKRFNSPNDVIVKSNGDIYFTDPIYGLPEREKDKTPRDRLLRRLPLVSEDRRGHAPHQGAVAAERPRLLARREAALRGQLRSGQGDLDGLSRAGRRHDRRRQGVQGRDEHGRQGTSRPARRAPRRRQGQPVRDRPRRRPRLRARRHAARPHRHRPGDRQLRLRRRRQRPLHHRRHVHRPGEDEDERRGL